MQTERYIPHLGPEMWESREAGFERAKRDARSWLEGQVGLMWGEGSKTLAPHLVLGRWDAAIEAGIVVVESHGQRRMRGLVDN